MALDTPSPKVEEIIEDSDEKEEDLSEEEIARKVAGVTPEKPKKTIGENDHVFISHGKSRQIVNQLKELLTFGKFKPVVSNKNLFHIWI